MIKWSNTASLDSYYTVKGLRQQIALVDKNSSLNQKPMHKRNEELANVLAREVDELNQTLKIFGVFTESGNDLKKRVDIMKRIREELGDVFFYSFRVANALNIDVSRAVHEKIYSGLEKLEKT